MCNRMVVFEGLGAELWNEIWVVLDGKICDPSSQTKAFEMIRNRHGSTRYVEASRATTDAWLICLKKQYE